MAIQTEWCSENPVFVSSDNACAAGLGLDALSRLCFPPPPSPSPHQQQQPLEHQFQFLQPKVDQNYFGNMPHFPLNNLAAEFEKQKLDLDRFMCLQNERFRFAIQEQRKQQLGLMMKTYEAKTQVLLKQKEEEMREAMKKRAELERLLKRVESEKQTWQRVAKEKEAMVACLSNTFERVRESAWLSGNRAEDAESCCEERREAQARDDDDDDDEAQALLLFLDEGEQVVSGKMKMKMKMVCKSCNVRSSCVVFLPCRHLSSCKPCEAGLHSCPICRLPKKSKIEALLS